MKYRPEIDGLRALAVMPVLFFHAGFGWAQGGFVGVDIFFVISGYLITSILLEELRTDAFSMLGFYDRRLRRIVPALFVMCIATIPPAWLWMLPQEFDDYAQSLFATSVSGSNFVFWQETDYFAAANELKPLLHTWSLAVEDQYYLIFPPLLALLFRRGRVIVGIALLSVASFGLTQILARTDPAANFYLLPTRFWELGIGALLAAGIALPARSIARADAAALAGLVLIGVSIFLIDGNRAYPGWWTIPAVLGTALVIAYAQPGTLAARLLGWKPFVAIGLISYSTYLWHQPLFAFARIRLLEDVSTGLLLALIAASLALGYLSWRFVERPFRDRRWISRKWIFANTVIFATAIFGFGLAMDLVEPNALRARNPELASIEKRMEPNVGLDWNCDDIANLPAACATADQPEVLVWGDSYAMHLVDGILASNPQVKLIQLTKSVCGPFLDFAVVQPPKYPVAWSEGCVGFNRQVRAYVEKTPSIRYVVLSAALNRYANPAFSSLIDGAVVPASADQVGQAMSKTLAWLGSRGIRAVVVSPMPSNGRDVGVCAARGLWLGVGSAPCSIARADAKRVSAASSLVLDALPAEIPVVRLADVLCEDTCPITAGDTLIYRDGGHLSREGSRYLGQKLGLYQLITAPQPAP